MICIPRLYHLSKWQVYHLVCILIELQTLLLENTAPSYKNIVFALQQLKEISLGKIELKGRVLNPLKSLAIGFFVAAKLLFNYGITPMSTQLAF